MHAVILAAGRNRRLQSRIAAFEKPLVEIDGAPLVAQLAGEVVELCERVVIVVSPENAVKIRDAVYGSGAYGGIGYTDKIRLVVQCWPSGPGDALRVGIEATGSGRVLVCMGDNIIRRDDIERVLDVDSSYVVGVRRMAWTDPDARRLAVLMENGRFYGHDPSDPSDPTWDDGEVRAWLGPLIVPRYLKNVLTPNEVGREHMITPMLNRLEETPKMVEVDCIDIGTIEALTLVTR